MRSRALLPPLAWVTAVLGIAAVAFWGLEELASTHDTSSDWSREQVEDWFKYEFSEIKGIAQQFLTMIVGVLVLSITFSEKVVRYDSAEAAPRFFLHASWCCLVLALIGGGSILALVMMSAAFVRYPGSGDYMAAQSACFIALVVSGVVFVIGLVALVASGATRRGRAPVDQK